MKHNKRIKFSASIILFSALVALTGCGSEPSTGLSEPEVAIPTFKVLSTVTSGEKVNTNNGDSISEIQFERSDGTTVICFKYREKAGYGGMGGLECPEWAQPKPDQIPASKK